MLSISFSIGAPDIYMHHHVAADDLLAETHTCVNICSVTQHCIKSSNVIARLPDRSNLRTTRETIPGDMLNPKLLLAHQMDSISNAIPIRRGGHRLFISRINAMIDFMVEYLSVSSYH
jgi:hypothetical protein